MLSSIASFLPSALHINQGPELPRPTVNPDTEDEDDEEEEEEERQRQTDRGRGFGKTNANDSTVSAKPAAGGNGGQPPPPPPKGKEKEKMANEFYSRMTIIADDDHNDHDDDSYSEHRLANISMERVYPDPYTQTFIFVRPPPSKTNHPLNLQVQLVPPNARPPTGVAPVSGNESTSTTATTPTSARSTGSSNDGAELARTSSNRSETSFATTSYNTSTASFNSISSNTSSSNTSTTRRNIIPLYNLQAHNVMTNVIVDAGTDAKIAKFQKRGIELIDLAVLEPVEVWGEKDKEREVRRESMRISVDEMGAMMTGGAGSASMNASGTNPRGSLLSAKIGGGFFPGSGAGGGGGSNSRPVTPSAASSAASLHSNLRHETTSIASSSSKNKTPVVSQAAPQQFHPEQQLHQQPQQPQQKRNLFNKLFNKRNNPSSPPASSSSNANTMMQQQQEPDTPPASFASFSLHPAPVVNRIMNIGKDKDRERERERGRPPPLQEPFTSPTTSPTSQETTPTEMGGLLTPKQARADTPVSPAVTIAPPPKEREKERERGHGRNLSLTSAITTPFKTTLKNNRNRLSAVIGGNGGGGGGGSVNGNGNNNSGKGSGNALAVPSADEVQRQKELVAQQQQKLFDQVRHQTQREASPNPSMSRSSRSQLSLHADSVGATSSNGGVASPQPQYHPQAHQPQPLYPHQQQQVPTGFYPLMQTPTQELKYQQLQLRPPVLGIQPTFVSASSSSSASGAAGTVPPSVSLPLVAALSPRISDGQDNLLQGQRALMYVWLVRRWLKKRPSGVGLGVQNPFGESGMFGGMKGGKGHGQEASGGPGGGGSLQPYGGVEVRFEWKRAKGKDAKGSGKNVKKSRRGRGGTTTSNATGTARSKESSTYGIVDAGGDSDPERNVRNGNRIKEKERERERDKNRSESKRRASNRMSTGSLSTAATASEEGLRADEDDGAGEDSDPEDSETPWVCTLKIRRNVTVNGGGMVVPNDLLSPALGVPSTMHGRGSSSASQSQPGQGASSQGQMQQPQVMRVKVGTLSPTPHHPKVVAMLKIPFPLPDVEVERMGIVKRKGFPIPSHGQAQADSLQPGGGGEDDGEREEPYTGLTLTAEEIKDMVCSTGLWLVVREGFGGVGRVSRKGDGWRIRA